MLRLKGRGRKASQGCLLQAYPTPTSRPRQVLSAHARLPGAVPAGLADTEAARDAARAGRAAAGRADRLVERPAGEPLPASLVGVAGPPPAHAAARLDNAAADHDAAGRPPPRGVGRASGRRIGAAAPGRREGYGRQRAQGLQDRLLEAATEDVPDIVREMGPYRRWLDGPLARGLRRRPAKHDARRQLHASLGLLPVDRGQVGYLRDRLLTAAAAGGHRDPRGLAAPRGGGEPAAMGGRRGREEAAWRAPAGGLCAGGVCDRTTRGGSESAATWRRGWWRRTAW